MGCCASSHDENKAQFPCLSKSPPKIDEETVKEVLSETPNTKTDQPSPNSKLVFSPRKPHFEQKLSSYEPKLPYYLAPRASEENASVSELSEMCSLSETISTTTLEDHQMQMQCSKSQGYNSHFQLKNHGRSPLRRVDPSPPRRVCSGSSTGQVGPRGNSPRRARSPANRARPDVGRSPSARRTGPSPGRVRMIRPGEGRRVEDEEEWAGPMESLENPLVSLECFIFL